MHTWFAAATEFSCVFRMADTSGCCIQERWVASVCVRERQHTGQTMCQVMTAFRGRFNKAPPRRATLLDWEKRAVALGSVKERPRSGRKTTRLETCSGLPHPLNFPQWSRLGNDRQSLVCHGQQCETTWRKTWMWGRIAQLLWMNCRMATWIGAMNHAVLCWTHSQVPYPAQRFFSVTNVPSIYVLRAVLCCVNLNWVWGAYCLGVRWLLAHPVYKCFDLPYL
jgi:hypothetical protein